MGKHYALAREAVPREVFLPAIEGYIIVGEEKDIGVFFYIAGGANLDEPAVSWVMKVPDDFVSFSSAKAIWVSDAVSGNMFWEMVAQWWAAGENVFAGETDMPGAGATATAGIGITNVQEPANPLTLTNLARGDYLALGFGRTGSDPLDTLDPNVFLAGILFSYTAEQ